MNDTRIYAEVSDLPAPVELDPAICTPHVTVTTDSEGIHVMTTWTAEGVEPTRTSSEGYGLGRGHKALAARLKAAIEAGAVYYGHYLGTDVYGDTYISAHSRVLGRYMNADLTRLGF